MTQDFVANESTRLEQGGMGYLQFHAAVAWIRSWLTDIGVTFKEQGDLGWVAPVLWEISDEEGLPFWISFDLKSVGHLLYSIDKDAWNGMDVTFYPPTKETRWDMLLRRIRKMREYGPNKPIRRLNGR